MRGPGMNRDSDPRRAGVRALLAAHHTLTLATTEGGRPWAAALFYAFDDALDLYFVSDPSTRHGRGLGGGGSVAAAIHPDCRRWADVEGLQIEGRASVLEGGERARALERYLDRFPEVRRLLERPRDADERKIADRLRAASLYRLRPSWIRWIDNRRGFGAREELDLS